MSAGTFTIFAAAISTIGRLSLPSSPVPLSMHGWSKSVTRKQRGKGFRGSKGPTRGTKKKAANSLLDSSNTYDWVTSGWKSISRQQWHSNQGKPFSCVAAVCHWDTLAFWIARAGPIIAGVGSLVKLLKHMSAAAPALRNARVTSLFSYHDRKSFNA